MAETVLVVGATGYAGRYIVQKLARKGYEVRAVVRSPERAEEPGPFGSPSLAGNVAQWIMRPLARPGAADSICEGVTRVVSALGVTRQNADPWDVDFLANLRVLADAERHQVRSFLFVNVMNVWSGRSMILRSKAAFTAALERSSVTHQLINPSGYFSDMSEFLQMARMGVVILPPDPDMKIAPIHGSDLADFCVEKMTGESGSWDVGGPDVLTYRKVADFAGKALGRNPRIVRVPRSLLRAGVRVADHLGRRPRDLAQFFSDGLTQPIVGERHGTHRLQDYFADLAAKR